MALTNCSCSEIVHCHNAEHDIHVHYHHLHDLQFQMLFPSLDSTVKTVERNKVWPLN